MCTMSQFEQQNASIPEIYVRSVPRQKSLKYIIEQIFRNQLEFELYESKFYHYSFNSFD